MSTPIDLTRRVRVRLATSHDCTEPGEMDPRRGLGVEVVGWGYRCPGCGQGSYLPRNGIDGETQGWTLLSGDPSDPATMTLSPSLRCLNRSCGWHGWLRAGELVPC